MKKMTLVLVIAIVAFHFATGQINVGFKKYEHFSVLKKKDTVDYYIYARKNLDQLDGFIIYMAGSGHDSWFTVDNLEKPTTLQASQFDLNILPENLAFVTVMKKGVPFIGVNGKDNVPQAFYETEGLDYRVWQNDIAINDIVKKLIKSPKIVIALGHSEGASVVAKLGTINKKITKIGFWSGSGETQFYDFALFVQKAVSDGSISEDSAKLELDSLFYKFKEIEADPNSITKSWLGSTYRRWSHFSEPAIDNLLKIDKPIFIAAGAKDENGPIESTLIIPIEFIRYKKNNLTFRLYPYYDHTFNKIPSEQNKHVESHWNDVFQEFINWAVK